jgi:hypothetical protein
MSQAKYQDSRIVEEMLEDTVRWFHESRKHPENADRDLYELARECANGSFKNNVVAIPEARRETVARKFMEACAQRFSYEVAKVSIEQPEVAM